MKSLSGLVVLGWMVASAQAGTFSIVAIPDTQYYGGSDVSFVYADQMNWIKNNAAAYNIKLVLGLGDIVDNGGGTGCTTALPNEPSTALWQNASNAVGILDSANIPYMMTIGNHDYDCHNDIPEPRTAANFNQYFGPSRYANKSWFTAGQHGWYETGSNENFYNTFVINGRDFLVLSLEFFPRTVVLNWANTVVSAFPNHEVIVIMHAFLNYDTSGSPGSASRLGNGMSDSAATYYPGFATSGIANNGSDMWTKFVSLHPNIRTVLSGHIRLPSPGTYAVNDPLNKTGVAPYPASNGAGRRSDLNNTGHRVNQLLSDYQGQGLSGYFGYGYLRIYTFDDVADTLKAQTFSPAIASDSTAIETMMTNRQKSTSNPEIATLPAAWKTDPYNAFTMTYEPMSSSGGGPSPSPSPTSGSGITITSPKAGAQSSTSVKMSATASESSTVTAMAVYDNNVLVQKVSGSSVNFTVTLAAGTHNVVFQDWYNSGASVDKKSISVTVP
jgi:hypothetical protein